MNIHTGSAMDTPLHLAVDRNDLEAARELLGTSTHANNDANTQAGKFGRTPLHLAAKSGNVEMILALLDGGGDPNVRNTHGFTPLYVATLAKCVPAMEAILRARTTNGRVDVDVDAIDLGGMTPLISACCNGCPLPVVECLLSHGASLIATDSIGRRAEDWAREKNFPDIYALLTLSRQQR